jgi:hypothetical protein
MEQIKEQNEIISWSAFLGCMFVGMGIGSFFHQTGVGLLIGMGAGYIAEAIIENYRKR